MSLPAVGALGTVLFAAGAVAACAALRRRRLASPEALRKVLHVAAGLACATIPAWAGARVLPVVVAAALSAAVLLVVRCASPFRTGAGAPFTLVGRATWGELHFVAGVALLYAVSVGEPLRFLLPLAVLTFADPAAALLGRRCRPPGSAPTDRKTLAGSLAFTAVAFALGVAGLRLGTPWGLPAVVGAAVLLAVFTAAAERVARGGLDNLVVPLAGWAVLAALPAVGPAS